MSNNRCETCDYFKPDETGQLLLVNQHGVCFGVPPTTTVVPVTVAQQTVDADGKRKGQQTMIGIGFWPAVQKTAVCPNYKAKRNPRVPRKSDGPPPP